jgi:hypothetical protein
MDTLVESGSMVNSRKPFLELSSLGVGTTRTLVPVEFLDS